MNRLNLMVVGLAISAAASAQSITGANGVNHTAPFNGSITLDPANNPHVLSGDIYILPGATLTILPGVRFESQSNSTLAITRGAQIFAEGTQDAPIVFTSNQDTGVYRQDAADEWGNLTVMGSAYISEDQIPTNTASPSPSNYADMEGLTPANVSLNDYGGGDDNDDSGTIAYCSFSYGGEAAIVAQELNGLSLGGIGRNTDVHHIEILNNLDDGIEIWGGTVNLSYISIWNVGDDSLDIDQGWRGKAQFGLIVQGVSNSQGQGSGFGDNALEIDGAERCDWQPVTTAAIHNFTVIGGDRPAGVNPTDELVEFRDNSRVQFLNCIFMDAGKEVINDNVTDGEGNNNLTVCGAGGVVPQMVARMTTPATSTYAVNPFANPATAYQAQNPAGNLVEFRGCVYYNNNSSSAYTEALGYGVFPSFPLAGTNHANNTISLTMPVTTRTRSATTFIGAGSVNHGVNPITFLDPTPAGDALSVAEVSPNDGFFRSAPYCGGFAPGNNWLMGWTRTSVYGLTNQRSAGSNEPIHGTERSGASGHPVLYTTGNWAPNTQVTQTLDNLPIGVGLILFSTLPANTVAPTAGLPIGFLGLGVETLVPNNVVGLITTVVGAGSGSYSFTMPASPSFAGQQWFSQGFGLDPSVPVGQFTSSNAQRHNL